MSKEQAQEAIIQISNIVDQWTDMNLDANDALELLAPLLKTVISYFDLELAPAGEKKSKNEKHEVESEEDLEISGAEVESERLQESEEGDLFSKTEDLEAKKEDVSEGEESKSKSKKPKRFAGDDGEIPF